METNNRKNVVVTGSSSGIGFETALLLARSGFHTYATMRNLDKSQKIADIAKKENLPLEILRLDIVDDKSIKDAFERIVEEMKRIDVVVNNAGYVLMGAIEDLSIDEIKAQFETNVFGAIKVIHSVMPVMRKQRSGTIVNVSSIEGRMAFPLNAAYVSTKFAIEGLSQGMRHEAREFGINVITVAPGAVRTNFVNNAKVAQKATSPDSAYAQMMQTFFTKFTPLYEKASEPKDVAKVILRAVTSDNSDYTYLVGNDAASLMKSKKNMSDREFEELIRGAKTYAAVI